MNFRFFLNNQQVDEPVGWDAVVFAIKRMDSYGIDQSFTTGVTFTGDQDRMPDRANGADILRLAFVNEFINASVDVRIESDFVFENEQWKFYGLIDFATYEETEICDGCSDGVKVSIIEDEFREAFLRNQEVDLNLINETALDGTDIGPFNLGQVTLHSQQLYLQGNCRQMVQTATTQSTEDRVWPLYWQKSDFKGPFGSSFNVTGFNFSTTNVIFKNNTSFTRTFKLNGKLKCLTFKFPGATITISIKFQIYLSNGSNGPEFYAVAEPISGNEYKILEATITDFILTLGPGESFQVLHYLSTSIQGKVVVFFNYPDENYLNWEELNLGNASLCRGVYVYDFLDRIITMVTGQANKLRSDYFEYGGCQWNHLITTGLYIRNGQLLENADPQIPTTFKKFFDALDRIFCLGWEFEEEGYNEWVIRIEPRSYFFQRQITSEFFNVSGITRKPNLDLYFNQISVGFNDNWKNTSLSGIFEMHTNREYHARNKAMENGSSKKLDLLTDIIASGYAIEYSRRLQFFEDNSGTSDRPNDYEIFIIWLNRNEVSFEEIEGTGYEVADQTGPFTFLPGGVSYGSNFINFTNSPIANLHNTINTPARIAIRWWKWLGMNTYGLTLANKRLFFQTGQYYTALQTRLDANDIPYNCNEVNDQEITVHEDMDIEQNLSMDEIIANPVEYTFTAPQELCDFLRYQTEGKKVIQFSCGNSIFAGFLMMGQNSPTGDKGGETEFTLLATEPPIGRAYSNAYSNGYS